MCLFSEGFVRYIRNVKNYISLAGSDRVGVKSIDFVCCLLINFHGGSGFDGGGDGWFISFGGFGGDV